ncbi:MAG: hypothetical protein GY899_18710 [Verrucomicrobiaceae bacterium]|nr:hypothetical protein [Verrucomicrobiaceae bacterium]
MDRGHLHEILETILTVPTAPFHEYHVREAILQLLKPCDSVQIKEDDFGNLIVLYGDHTATPGWIFGSHMDHPGFVALPEGSGFQSAAARIRDQFTFLGGVPESYLLRKFPIREFGRFAMWDLPGFDVRGTQIWSRACDDLVGCAVIVALLIALDRSGVELSCAAVFTRAEEVGFIGATRLGKAWPFQPSSCFVSIETSVAVDRATMGGGPMCRVGDRISIFDHTATAAILEAAQRRSIKVQRALLDRGACEASGLQAYGIRTAGISVPLGNYHNCGKEDVISPEFVESFDVEGLFDLMAAILEEFPQGPMDCSEVLRKRFESGVDTHLPFIKGTSDLFLPLND